MTFCLNTKIIEPEKNKEIKNAIILLHGYGGDGKDISSLSYNWKRFLKNSVFLCPDAHEKCSINPNGFQWFDLTKEDPNYIIQQVLIAEKKILPELIQGKMTPFNLFNNIIPYLDTSSQKRKNTIESYKELKLKLGPTGIFDRAAKRILFGPGNEK